MRQFGQQDWKFLASHFPVSMVPLFPPLGARAMGDQSVPRADFLPEEKKMGAPSSPSLPKKKSHRTFLLKQI